MVWRARSFGLQAGENVKTEGRPRPAGQQFLPWATAVIVFAAVALFSLQFILGADLYQWVCVVLALFPVEWYIPRSGPDFLDPHWVFYFSRLFGYSFVHGDWRHLAYNSLSVLLCGYFVERQFVEGGLGRRQYLVFAWMLGVLGGISNHIWVTLHFDVFGKNAIGIGMSAIGFGLAGTMLVVGGKIPLLVRAAVVFGVLIFLEGVMAFVSGGQLLPLSVVSHLTGLISGVLLGDAARRWLREAGEPGGAKPGTKERIQAALGYLVVPIACGLYLFRRGSAPIYVLGHAVYSMVIWGVSVGYFGALAFLWQGRLVVVFESNADLLLAMPFFAALSTILALALHAFSGAAVALPWSLVRHPEVCGKCPLPSSRN